MPEFTKEIIEDLRDRVSKLERYGDSCDNEIANLQKRVGKLEQKLAERESVEAGEA